MKNIALIIAGGVGARMNQEIPKQFLNVKDKPVIIYALETFQKHPNIDVIEVVCLEGWHDILRAYANQFKITKLEKIVNGGINGQDSIRNGLFDLFERYHDKEDVVLIHDAIRPMLSADIISNNIKTCREKGNCITVIPCDAVMLKTYNGIESCEQVPRDFLKNTQTPQTFYINEIVEAHKEALSKGITNSVASCSMYIELGKKLYMTVGSKKNFKITETEDIEMFLALLNAKRPDWILD